MGLYACVALLLALHSILAVADSLVEADNLAVERIPVATDSLVVVDNPVAEGNLEEGDSLGVEHSLEEEENLVVEHSPLEEGNIGVAHTPVVEILEEAFAARQCRIVVARVDQDLSPAFLPVAVQVMVLLLVVPGCS
jgi:hypothetical protein